MKKILKKGPTTFLLVVISLGTALVLRPPSSLRLREVIVTSVPRRLSEQDLLRLSEVQQGQNLLRVSLTQVREKILRYPWVKDVRVARTFPGRLQISVVEQEPVALLDLGDLYLINREGEIFKKVVPHDSNKDLPLITGFSRGAFQKEGTGAESLAPLLALLLKVQEMPVFQRVGISELHRYPEGEVSLFTVAPVMRLSLGSENWERRLERFSQVADLILSSSTKPFFIDLSYDQRIFVKRRG